MDGDGGYEHNLQDYEKTATIPRTGDPSYMYTGRQRPMSMACVPTTIAEGGIISPQGTLRRKPPPPIRRTPSGGSLTGMDLAMSQSQFDSSGTFKVPLPVSSEGRNRSVSVVSQPEFAQQQREPPPKAAKPVGRSQSLRLPSDPTGAMSRLSLMESLNARLAQRQDGDVKQGTPAAPPPVASKPSMKPPSSSQATPMYQQQQNPPYQQPSTYGQNTGGYQPNTYQQQQNIYQQQQQPNAYQQPQQQQDQQQQQPASVYQPYQQQQYTHSSPTHQRSQQQMSYQQQSSHYQQQQQQSYQQQPPYQQQQQQQPQYQQQQYQQSMSYGQSNMDFPPPPQNLTQPEQPKQDSSSDEEEDIGTGTLAEIKRGVKLRRTISNDRSAPKI